MFDIGFQVFLFLIKYQPMDCMMMPGVLKLKISRRKAKFSINSNFQKLSKLNNLKKLTKLRSFKMCSLNYNNFVYFLGMWWLDMYNGEKPKLRDGHNQSHLKEASKNEILL